MPQSTRAQLVALLNSKVLSGGRQTTAQNIRDFENAIIQSMVDIIDDKDQASGYLGLDANSKVNTTFISKITPTGDFLRDDGTWAAIGGAISATNGLQIISGSVGLGSSLTQNTTITGAYDLNFVGLNSMLAQLTGAFEVNTDNGVYAKPYIYLDPVSDQIQLSSAGFTLFGQGTFWTMGANTMTMNLATQLNINTPSLLLAGLTPSTLPYLNASKVLSSSSISADGNNLLFATNYGIDTSAAGTLNIGATNASVINYGNASTIHNFLGTAIYELQVNSYVTDKLMTLNYGGAVSSGIGVGFEIQENNVIKGYFKTNAARNAFDFLTPAIAYKSSLSLASLTADRVHTLPDVTDTLVGLSASQALTNKTYNGNTWTAGSNTLTLAGNLITSGAYSLTLTQTGATNVTLPTTGTLATLAGTETFTNKRRTRRIVTTTQSATPTINTDNTDVSNITGLAQAITSFTTNLSGTPIDGDLLEIRITDNGTARAITWGASFASSGNVTLPSTTVISTMLRVGFEWNGSVWVCIAFA